MPQKFIEVILPLAVEGTFTYAIPAEFQGKLQRGQRVVVPFGGKKLYTGVIYSFHNEEPELYKVKSFIAVLEDYAIVPSIQLDFWNWMANYYMSSIGDVYRLAVPSALKLESETFISKNTDKAVEWEVLDEYETLVMQSLEQKSAISLKEIEAFVPQKNIIPVVRALYEEGWISIDEKLKQKYNPKYLDFLRVNPKLEQNPILFQDSLESLEKAPKQKELLFQLIQEKTTHPHVQKTSFLKKFNFSNAVLKGLESKNIIEVYSLQQERMKGYEKEVEQIASLSSAQEAALESIQNNWSSHEVNLLDGVTSSGKTEIYIQLIQKQLDKDKNTLFLLPEIAITTQLLQRLQKKFGNDISIYHSKLNSQERVEVYKKVLQNKVKMVVGARSALFLPFADLGLIIVDEEHETSYKQSDIKPYFNARDSAIVLAKMHDAKVLLGSATPSLESIENCQEGKYGKVDLKERYGKVKPPKVSLINLQYEGNFLGEISPQLEHKMNEVLDAGKQIILFQNRRGYTPIMECVQCGYSSECPNCDVKLTYHKISQNLKCHYCNYTSSLLESCPVCQSKIFNYKGLGTQKIEEEVVQKFPEIDVFRMDSDTMRKKNAYEELFDRFESGEIKILIGTQMISKGLDFSNVGLVAVVKTDSLFNIPDFRIEEKTYQLLMQVAGRAGRRKEQGEVIFQTYQSNNLVYQSIIQGKQEELYTHLLTERKSYQYPPYFRIIEIEFRYKNFEKVNTFSQYFTHSMYSFIPQEYVLGPTQPSVGKIRNEYIFNTMIKLPKGISMMKIKKKLNALLAQSKTLDGFKSMKVKVVVDPV